LLQCEWAFAVLIYMQAAWWIQRSNSLPVCASVDISTGLFALPGCSTSWCKGNRWCSVVHGASLQILSAKHSYILRNICVH
jgi:hypothetical protein